MAVSVAPSLTGGGAEEYPWRRRPTCSGVRIEIGEKTRVREGC
jgi:hypothetical protein